MIIEQLNNTILLKAVSIRRSRMPWRADVMSHFELYVADLAMGMLNKDGRMSSTGLSTNMQAATANITVAFPQEVLLAGTVARR